MITDPLFYRLFETSPETFFLMLGMPAELARAMTARYQYEALEFKETAHRSDGIFRPLEPGLPLYVLEVQFYPPDRIDRNGHHLQTSQADPQGDPGHVGSTRHP